MSSTFLDTNVLVYANDPTDRAKQIRARSLLRTLLKEGRAVISTQVLQEFFVSATRKLKMDPLLAKTLAHDYCNFETVLVTPALIEAAMDCSILHGLSFWDSLIVVSAEHARCAELWTEDLNAGQMIRGVRIVNPFAPPR